jgi:AraC-like DNA-binding protein/mannose-6-phosphate isomerase-like protein (cupin superfamily)
MAAFAKAYPYHAMEKQPYALDRLELHFRWGRYGIRMLRFHLAMFSPGHTINDHQHSEYEFHFICGGKGVVTMGGVDYELKEGLFYLTGPGVVHAQYADERDPMRELCLHIDIGVPDNEGSVPPLSSGAGADDKDCAAADECIERLRQLPPVPLPDRHDAAAWFPVAHRALLSHEPGLSITIRQCIMQIMLRAAYAGAGDSAAAEPPARDMKEYRFRLASDFIQDNFRRPLTLETVAERVHISGRQLQRIFAERGGTTFSEYVEKVRLAKACERLVQTREPIERIALEHGFSTSNYFHRVFKKRFGCTAKQYRERHQ